MKLFLSGATGETLAHSQRVSNRLFKEVCGWSPRDGSAREGFPALVAQLKGSCESSLCSLTLRDARFDSGCAGQ